MARATGSNASSTRLRACIAVNRFGLGARPGELTTAAADPQGWLLRQISPGAALPPGLGAPTTGDFAAREVLRSKGADGPVRKAINQWAQSTYELEVDAAARAHVTSLNPFAERAVLFWANHFTVSVIKQEVRSSLAPSCARRSGPMSSACSRTCCSP